MKHNGQQHGESRNGLLGFQPQNRRSRQGDPCHHTMQREPQCCGNPGDRVVMLGGLVIRIRNLMMMKTDKSFQNEDRKKSRHDPQQDVLKPTRRSRLQICMHGFRQQIQHRKAEHCSSHEGQRNLHCSMRRPHAKWQPAAKQRQGDDQCTLNDEYECHEMLFCSR